MSTHFANPDEPYTTVTPQTIRELVASADNAPLRRARLCLHSGPDDPLHEMIIAFRRDSYVAPHRHLGKSESFHVIEGEIEVVFFDDHGAVTSRLVLSAAHPASPRVYRLRAACWHTVIVRSDWAVIHETTNGPFRPVETETAPWAPAAQDAAAVADFFLHLNASPSPT